MGTEWPLRTVKELQDEGILLVEDGNHGEYRPRPSEFQRQGTAFIRAANINGNGRILFESADCISEAAVERIRKGKARPGDVLFSHKGTVGKLALAPPDAPPFVCSPQTTFWRTLDTDRLDRGFLYAFMRSEGFRRQWFARKGETDMADYVSLTAQRTFTVPLPPIDEQRAIARVVAPLDDKIEANRALNETLETTCQTLFRSWFVDFDPVVAKSEGRRPPHLTDEVTALFPDRFEDSRLGPVPAGWRAGKLGGLLELAYGKALPARDRIPGPIQVYGSNGAVGSHSTALVKGPGIVVGRKGSAGCVTWTHTDFFPIDTTYYVQAMEEVPLTYAYYVLKGLGLEGSAGDSAVPGLNRELTYLLDIVMPPGVVVRQFGATTKDLFAAMHQGQLESQTLATLRDALLPRLLSGELRVRQAEQLVEEAL